MSIMNLLNKNSGLSKDELVFLLNLNDESAVNQLFDYANEIRNKHFGQNINLHGVISFSNNCYQNCLFCGLREDNLFVPRYRMSAEEILESAKLIYTKGVRTIILQSGEDSAYDTDLISYIIYSLKRQFDVLITLNIGQRSFDEYKTWKIAGADNYLLKYETSNQSLFSNYHGKAKLSERLNHLNYLKRIGYSVGSGGIIGVPHQTYEDIAEDIMLYKKLKINMAAFAPFVPATNTPYQNCEPASILLTLKVMAILRIIMGKVDILSASALDSMEINGCERGLRAGANFIMSNYTPDPYRKYYQVFRNDISINDDPVSAHKLIKARIEALGKRISDSETRTN